jgi:hypothetical protein
MPYGQGDQPGVFTPYNVLFATQGVWRHTVGMTGEFFGDQAVGTKARAARSLGRYATGRPLDQQTTRRLAGTSWLGKPYAKLRDRSATLAKFAPNLSYLGPARYMTLWAGLAGHQGAGAGLGAMRAVHDVAAQGAVQGIDVFSRTGGAQMFEGMAGYDLKAAKAAQSGGASFFDAFISGPEGRRPPTRRSPTWRAHGGDLWGDYVKSDSAVREEIRILQQRLLAGDKTAGYELTRMTGGRAGGRFGGGAIYDSFGRFISGKVASNSAFYIGMGRALPSIARFGTAGFMGIDLFTIGAMGASLMGKAAVASMKAPINTYNAMTADIHRGTFMSSSPLSPFVGATQRQRAMANIYDRQLNLRQVLGNEAAYFSRL